MPNLTRKSMQIEALEGRQLLAATPWGQQSKLIGQDLLASQFPNITGAGQTVVVIDSGVAYNHPVLAGKYIGGWDFAANDSNPWPDADPHGTGVATEIAASAYDYKGYHFQGIAPGVKILALRQTNSYGADAALKWVIANKAKYNITAVNMTDKGGGTAATWNSMKASIATLSAMNVMVTIPAGNTGSTAVPNYGGNEIAVGSTTAWGYIANSSVRGPGLDFLAPAEQVTLPYYYGGPIYTDQAVGTSWAAPQIAGASTLLRQINPNFTNAQIVSILTDSGTKVYDSWTRMTFPLINLYSAVKLAYQRIGQPVPTAPAPAPAPTPAPQAPAGNTGSTATALTNGTVIQVEDFDAGTNGSAYKELDPTNYGGNNYRPGTGVDIFTINDGGSTRAVGGNRAGEWLRYSVDVKVAGTYTVEFRLASLGDGGKFHFEVDGKNVTGPISAGNTGSWSTWASVYKTVSLTAGKHSLYLCFDQAGPTGAIANFNSMKFTAGSTAPVTTTPAPTTAVGPFRTINVTAGQSNWIEAEEFDNGARGQAWWDTDTVNTGGQFRTNTGVDIATTTDAYGGYMVGATRAGEWMNYTVNFAKSALYTFDVRQAQLANGGTFHIEVDGKNVSGTLGFKNTGGWQSWTTVTRSGIAVTAGKHTISLVVDSVSTAGIGANLNWIRII